jgi:hypothetical protein
MPQDLVERKTEFAKQFNITYDQYQKLATTLSYEELVCCLELLHFKHRNTFRHAMLLKVQKWLQGLSPASKPLSPREFASCKPTWPIKYELPK